MPPPNDHVSELRRPRAARVISEGGGGGLCPDEAPVDAQRFATFLARAPSKGCGARESERPAPEGTHEGPRETVLSPSLWYCKATSYSRACSRRRGHLCGMKHPDTFARHEIPSPVPHDKHRMGGSLRRLSSSPIRAALGSSSKGSRFVGDAVVTHLPRSDRPHPREGGLDGCEPCPPRVYDTDLTVRGVSQPRAMPRGATW